jgi:hypothetical protein
MTDDTDPFVFPDMPDEAVVAVGQFLEAFLSSLPKPLLRSNAPLVSRA